MKYGKIMKLCGERQLIYDKLSKQNLLVKFEMSTPFSTMDYIRLDGLLAYFALRELLGDDFYNIRDYEEPIDSPLPLEKCKNDSGQWWWACSFGVSSSAAESITRWKKRWDDENDDLVDFGNKLARVNHKAAHFKAYDMPLVIKLAKEIIFCCRGNLEEVENLLAGCRHIGKKRSQGYGQVRKITVSETDQAWHSWIDDRPTRAIPVGKNEMGELTKKLGKVALSQIAYKPPYWHQKNTAWCYTIDI